MENINIWRIQTNTSKGDIAQYCLENNIAAVGWSLTEHPYKDELSNLNFAQYCELADKYYDSYSSVSRLANDFKVNDLIWMRCNGFYYLAQINEKSVWTFNNSESALEKDASNQISNIYWIKIGDESEIPGALTTSFIRGSTLQRIYKPGILEYSELIFDQKSRNGRKYNRTIELSETNFYSLISPSDCEDLLYMWLYDKSEKNYVCIPSTNKLATEKYEFVILDSQTGKHIYIQVKNGETTLNSDDYRDLINNPDDEVYLLSTRGQIINAEKYDNIYRVDPTELFEFAINESNANIIPPNIKYWIEFAGGYYTRIQNKGIIFDTNDEACEEYMFNNNVIAAWGTSKRYINSFNQNDYVLYYKKSVGIIAIGKIISENSTEITNDGLQHSVRIIVACEKYANGEIKCIKPSEIKSILNKPIYFASTRKVPFLSINEVNLLIDNLMSKP